MARPITSAFLVASRCWRCLGPASPSRRPRHNRRDAGPGGTRVVRAGRGLMVNESRRWRWRSSRDRSTCTRHARRSSHRHVRGRCIGTRRRCLFPGVARAVRTGAPPADLEPWRSPSDLQQFWGRSRHQRSARGDLSSRQAGPHRRASYFAAGRGCRPATVEDGYETAEQSVLVTPAGRRGIVDAPTSDRRRDTASGRQPPTVTEPTVESDGIDRAWFWTARR